MPRAALLAPVLAAALLLAAAAPGAVAQTGPAGGGAAVVLQAGPGPEGRPFPDDALTVADPAQATGRRVALPTAGCAAAGTCADLAVLNGLDGFDVRPRVVLPFSAPVDLLSITPETVRIERDGFRTGLTQLVQDPLTGTVTGFPVDQLAPGTQHRLVVAPGVRAADGSGVAVCAAGCPDGATSRVVPFTTMTTTSALDRVRAALDDGSAYTAAGIPADQRSLRFDTAGSRSVFPFGAGARLERLDQVRTAAGAAPAVTPVASTARTAVHLGVGSITSPQYLDAAGRLGAAPSTSAPPVRGAARLGVVVLAPAPRPDRCLRPVVFGHGLGGSKFDVLRAADDFGDSDLAVFATDVVGHGAGPRSQYRVTAPDGTAATGASLGRGRDLDGDGRIGPSEGAVQPGLVGLRDALLQTVVDSMALVRALERGVDLDGDGRTDTCTGRGSVGHYGQSLGGVYGTVLLGTDPAVRTGVPVVAGGPLAEVGRLGALRPLVAAALGGRANGGPGLAGFTESLPLRRDPSVGDPVQGALPVAEALSWAGWAGRSASPEAYAPRLGPGGAFADKGVLFQVARGDRTVPNPTSAEVLRAGDLWSRAWVYRHDRTEQAGSDPHAYLTDPALPAREDGQEQVRHFLRSGGEDERDPDGAGGVWEPVVPRAGTSSGTDHRSQLECLSYADPQTGRRPDGSARECTDRSGTVAPSRPEDVSRLVALPQPQRVLDTRADGGRVTGLRSLDLRRTVPDAAAVAAVLNVTVLGAASRGHVVVLPAGAPVPPTSNVNVEAAGPRDPAAQANQSVVRLSQDRRVDLLVETTAHVLVDVVGYLTPRSPTGGGRLQAVPARRLLDTRSTPARRRTGEVLVALPAPAASAAAVVLGVTVTGATGRGHLVARPAGAPRPRTSTLSYGAGQTRSNEVLVPVGRDGRVALDVVGAPAAVVVDLVGVVLPGGSGGYVALDAPLRAADSRTGAGLPRGPVRGPVDLVLPDAVPGSATGVLLTVTTTLGSAPGFVTVFPAGTTRPATSNLSFPVRVPQAGEVLARVGRGRAVTLQVDGGRGASAALVVDVVGYTTG